MSYMELPRICSESNTAAMRRLAREYIELPGLSLTTAQVQRLLNVDPSSARDIVAAFTRAGCLVVGGDGRVRRAIWVSGSGWRSHLLEACGSRDTAALHYEMT